MKPKKTEDEYIWVQELQHRIAKLEKEQQAESEAEKLRLKEAHWMHCPKCGQKLSTEKCGSVEIDVCPSCKGVWLDVGELGAIVESAGQGNFFHSCLRILRGGGKASVHLASENRSRGSRLMNHSPRVNAMVRRPAKPQRAYEKGGAARCLLVPGLKFLGPAQLIRLTNLESGRCG